MHKFTVFLKKALEIKVNVFILLFAGTVLVYAAATKGADGLWKFGSGDVISATQMNQNFEAVNVPSGAIMAFYRLSETCPEEKGWIKADGNNGTPDLRGVFIRGIDSGTGRDEVRTMGTYQPDAFQGHWHHIEMENDWSDGGGYLKPYPDAGRGTTMSDKWVRQAINDGTHGEPRTANETRPKNVALLYCMKK